MSVSRGDLIPREERPLLSMRPPPAPPDVILRRYGAIAPLTAADIELLRAMARHPIAISPGQEIECEGAAHAPRLILSGWACRFRILADGRRAIVSFLLPGDTVCPCRQARFPAFIATAALTPCRVLDGRPLWHAIASRDPRYARLAEAQQQIDMLDDRFLLDHVVRLSRQTAVERMCHLLLELRWRLQIVGLVRSREFVLPLTQEMLADAVGLSLVHVNRTLQTMRRRGLIALRQGRVVMLEPEAMANVAEFKTPIIAPDNSVPTLINQSAAN